MNALARSLTIFIDRALDPIRPWLEDDQVVEICANGPGEVWVERFGQSAMERHEVPSLTEHALRHLAERVAGHSGQSVNEEHPLLSAALPTGERFQGVMPPATTAGGAFAIRKQVIKEMRLHDYRKLGSFEKVTTAGEGALSETDRRLCEHLDAGRIEDFIRLAVVSRYSILLSGGTSSGKTTFLNAILKEVPIEERIITIEDTREVNPIQKNYLPLVASKGDQGEARVTVETLLQAADSPAGAFEQLAMKEMQAGLGLRRDEIVGYIRSVLPIVIQQTKVGGWRGTSAVHFSRMEEWRSERVGGRGRHGTRRRL